MSTIKSANQEDDSRVREEEALMKCRIALRRDYISLANSQAVRLVGLVAGLFAILQTFQNSNKVNFSELLPRITLNINLPDWLVNLFPWKFIAFLIPVFVISFFIFRAFFRFALLSAYSAHVKWIEKRELQYLTKISKGLKEKNLLLLVSLATGRKIAGDFEKYNKGYYRLKAYKIIPYDWFMSKNEKKGHLLCFFLSLLSTLILLGLLS